MESGLCHNNKGAGQLSLGSSNRSSVAHLAHWERGVFLRRTLTWDEVASPYAHLKMGRAPGSPFHDASPFPSARIAPCRIFDHSSERNDSIKMIRSFRNNGLSLAGIGRQASVDSPRRSGLTRIPQLERRRLWRLLSWLSPLAGRIVIDRFDTLHDNNISPGAVRVSPVTAMHDHRTRFW